jgi:PAS domain S-box-containing protein
MLPAETASDNSGEKLYRALFEAMRDGVLIVNDAGFYVDVNQSFCRLLKATRERLVGSHFSEFIPPERLADAEISFQRLRTAGGPDTPTEFPLRALDGSIVHLSWSSSSTQLPGLYCCSCRKIPDRAEGQLQSVLNHVPAFIAYVDTSYRYVRVNKAYEEWFGLPASQVQGKHIKDAFGEEHFREIQPKLQRVLAGEAVFFESQVVSPHGEKRIMSVTYTPDKDDHGRVHGFIALRQDITANKQSEAALRAREEELRRLLAALPDVISRFDRDLRFVYVSPAIQEFTGIAPAHFAGKTHVEAGLPEELSAQLRNSIRKIFDTGQPDTIEFDYLSAKSGLRHLLGLGFPEVGEAGETKTVLTIVRDITKRKRAENERAQLLVREQEARETAEILNSVAPLLVGELDTRRLVQAVTDIATKLVGAEFGSFFHNVTNDQGESYMLYTLSGVPREAFAHFPMPRNTQVFAPTFAGEGIVRVDDITKDPRYGKNAPHHGMPKGHLPVKSYLAVPVLARSGEVLGGLFFGHSSPAKFTERHETLVESIAAQSAIAMDNARLFEQARWTQDELKRSNEELRRANQDLETFAYSASHDLQEPLRNIAINAQLLQRSLGDLEGERAAFLSGVLQGARRMENLVRDLLSYTRATKYTEGPPPKISAAKVVAGIIDNMQTRIEQDGAIIQVDELPVVAMHEIHLSQLFQNLISNALKYRGKEAPRVHISSTHQDGWCVFSVADNGIGIEPQYANQIFTLFKRLHNRDEYPGSGIGLAICQRIVEQYGGRVWMDRSVPGDGSTFCFSVPDREF